MSPARRADDDFLQGLALRVEAALQAVELLLELCLECVLRRLHLGEGLVGALDVAGFPRDAARAAHRGADARRRAERSAAAEDGAEHGGADGNRRADLRVPRLLGLPLAGLARTQLAGLQRRELRRVLLLQLRPIDVAPLVAELLQPDAEIALALAALRGQPQRGTLI